MPRLGSVEPVVFEVADGIPAIDTFFGGRERYTAAYLLEAEGPTLVETGPSTSLEPVVAGLQRLGVGPSDLAHVVLTHIHLDHGGGVGAIAERYPNATVWVHERGAPHLADPARLVALADSRSGAVFTGDALGIHPPDVSVLRPATPPPDYDLEQAVATIERIRGRARGTRRLCAHFGP